MVDLRVVVLSNIVTPRIHDATSAIVCSNAQTAKKSVLEENCEPLKSASPH